MLMLRREQLPRNPPPKAPLSLFASDASLSLSNVNRLSAGEKLVPAIPTAHPVSVLGPDRACLLERGRLPLKRGQELAKP